MNKHTKKRTNFNEDILNTINKLYGFTLDYIRKSLRGDRVGEMPDLVIDAYEVLEKASKEAIEIAAKELKKPKIN
ncbi:hypothetical protein PL373_06125 [Tenacibaculum maritimum]|nr:hypothetical protein [Tenacibaculum maritimum]MDB0600728.1 hypothetical protein [Tenacibaculum maritimum]MDB0612711.1 hypothetical protein [Tenacibaculum maritimum]